MKRFHCVLSSIAIAAATLAAAAPSYALDKEDLYGTRVQSPAAVADRIIRVDERTRWVNVKHGETISFQLRNAEAPLVWQFGGLRDRISMQELASDAPALMVYVDQSTNPLQEAETGGDD